MRYNDSYIQDIRIALDSIPNKEALFGKRIFITGATGMVCSSVVDLLLILNRESKAGIKIVIAARDREAAAERFNGFSEADGLEIFHYDAMSKDEILYPENIDFIIHGASNANPEIYAREPVETMMANITGLEKMLKLAHDKSAKILYVSSSEVYGMKDGMEPFKEGDYGYLDILGTRAGYPSSKRAGESLCIAYGMEYGVTSVIVRPGHIYGPTIKDNDNRASAEFTRNALRGEDIVMRSKGTQLRSYCYTLDSASAMLTALIGGEAGNAYNISNPNAISTISDLAHAIAEEAGIEVRYAEVQEDQGKFSPMTNASLDSGKLEELGWIPAFDLKKGVASMLKAMKD